MTRRGESLLPLRRQRGDRRIQLLVAEDDPNLAQDLKERLQALDYRVLGTTHCAQTAVLLAERRRPDLVLMDIHLSGELDGIQAAEQIRKFQIPVVYVTGYCDGSVLDRAELTEPYGYVLKPYETSHLKVAVQLALCRHRSEQARQQLLQRLQDILAGAKTLTGRLSICCYCKKIKDATGHWPEVETYIMEHSYASFTHGICPGCFARMKRQIQAL